MTNEPKEKPCQHRIGNAKIIIESENARQMEWDKENDVLKNISSIDNGHGNFQTYKYNFPFVRPRILGLTNDVMKYE